MGGDEDTDTEEDVDRLLLTLNVFVLVAVVSGLVDDLIVGVITAVLNAVVDGDDVMVPVTDMKEVTEGVTVFCKVVVTVAVFELVVIDEREVLALTEGIVTPLALVHSEANGDAVIEAVSKVLDEWVFVVRGDTLAITDRVTADDKDGTTVIVDVNDASIETVVVYVLSIDTDDVDDGRLLDETLFDASLVSVA